jgi:hypothetical protein
VLHNGIRVQIAGIDPNADLVGDSLGTAVYNFYLGRVSSHWMTDVESFAAANLKNVYLGVRAAFTTASGQGKVIFSVAAFADPTPIRLRVLNTGATPWQAIRFRGYPPTSREVRSSSSNQRRVSSGAGFCG